MILLLLHVWSGELMLNANRVSFLPPPSCHPVAEDNGNVILTFTTGHTNPYLEIYFAILDNSGSLISLTNVSRSGVQSSQWAGYPNVVSFDTTYFFVWDDRRISYHELNFQNEVYYRIYYPDVAGGTWLNILNVTSNDGEWSINPSVTSLGKKVYIAWEDTKDGHDAVYCTDYQDGIWSSPMPVSQSEIYAGYPSIISNFSDVIVVYEEVIDSNVVINGYNITKDEYYGISTRGVDAYFPSTSSDGNTIAVVWEEYSGGLPDVYVRKFNGSWSDPVKLSINGYGEMPSVSGGGGVFYYVWIEDGDVLFSSDSSSIVTLNESSYNCSNPHILRTSTGDIYVFWNGYTEEYQDMKIFYRIFTSTVKKKAKSLLVTGGHARIPEDISLVWDLYTIDGRKVYSSRSNTLNINSLPEGIYIAKARTAGKVYRLIKLGE